MSQFVYLICKRIKLTIEKEILVFVNNVLPPTDKFNQMDFIWSTNFQLLFYGISLFQINCGSTLFLFIWEKHFKAIADEKFGIQVLSLLDLLYLSWCIHFYAADLMCIVYDEHKDEDGFLSFTYNGDNTFV